MTLSKLLDGVTVSKIFQSSFGRPPVTHDIQIQRVQYDSRKISQGDLFVAIMGESLDGHMFVKTAIANGSKAVVIENDGILPDSFFMHSDVVKIVVPDTRAALARIASNYNERPSGKLTMVGVTGTNGKTTTTHLIRSVLNEAGETAGLIGTNAYNIGDTVIAATHTTPESLELNGLLALMVEKKCSHAVMEVSSHALDQHRVDGIDFKAAVFTNLTQDHLDYHGSMDEYFRSKKSLFTNLRPDAWAVVNYDDSRGYEIGRSTQANIITYGMNSGADIRAENISLSMSGTGFRIMHGGEKTEIESELVGGFNVSNMLAAFGAGIALGVPKEKIRDGIGKTGIVRGRFERISSGKGWTAIVDYAHTPDAVEKVLKAIRDILGPDRRGRIITVFGCGGNRDSLKRPEMARIATSLSDMTIVTSDNPRLENPESIIDEVMAGIIRGAQVVRQPDRKKAIFTALENAKSGDVVLIAGKGHEEYQITGDSKVYFSDRGAVEEFLRTHE